MTSFYILKSAFSCCNCYGTLDHIPSSCIVLMVHMVKVVNIVRTSCTIKWRRFSGRDGVWDRLSTLIVTNFDASITGDELESVVQLQNFRSGRDTWRVLASSPGHSHVFNVTRRKWEGLVSKITCVTSSVMHIATKKMAAKQSYHSELNFCVYEQLDPHSFVN
jgi:hypothetical protein